MANRLFLTLLALLTGLAAQLAPAQARVCAEQTVAAALLTPAPVRAAAAPTELARLPEPGWRHARMVADEEGANADLALPTVGIRIRIDRARD